MLHNECKLRVPRLLFSPTGCCMMLIHYMWSRKARKYTYFVVADNDPWQRYVEEIMIHENEENTLGGTPSTLEVRKTKRE